MQIVVLGATGATGKLLVNALLQRDVTVRAIVRNRASLPSVLQEHSDLTIHEASISEMSDAELKACIHGCDGIASCLGHNLTFRGMFMPPRNLVSETIQRVCHLAETLPKAPFKVVLMNTAGCHIPRFDQPLSFSHRLILGLIRSLLPPHRDNERAAAHLLSLAAQTSNQIDWAIVRPDTLIDIEQATPYDTHIGPTRSALFDPGETSRINVAEFMADLLTDDVVWQRWRRHAPAIYNRP